MISIYNNNSNFVKQNSNGAQSYHVSLLIKVSGTIIVMF